MSGVDAREGFRFQDARILVRLLRDAISRHVARIRGEAIPAPIRIRIEAATEVDGVAQPTTSPRPLWDSVSVVGSDVIVDETKLGDVSKEERLALYARIRATVSAQDNIAGITPRLTTASGAQMNEDKWLGLAQESAAAPIPSKAPEAATTAKELAQEALFYLTSPQLPSRKRNIRGVLVDAPTPPMKEADARSVLGRFIFDDELDRQETEAELRRLLGELGGEFILDESIRQLHGWISEKACVRPEGAEMTCETLGDEVRVLARYMTWNAEAEALVQRLRAGTPPRIETRLDIRQWRDVQPTAAIEFDPASSKRLVFVADGGVGKSFALSQLHREMLEADFCLWIDATGAYNLQILAEAVGFGAWVAKRSCQRLTVLIDGLDHTPPPTTAAVLLSTVHGALAGYDDALVISAARTPTWSLITAASRVWREIRLEPWAAEAVTTLPFTATLPPDLIDLLRTPLLLDLYLRTLDDADPEPLRPTTRHELVSDFFRWILSRNKESSPARRALIEKLGTRVAAGQLQWLLGSTDATIANQLVGEGLLIDDFGRHRFRHSLLQDVSVVMALSSADPDACAARLRAVTSSTLRHDVTRSLIEAATASGPRRALLDTPPVQDLLRALLASRFSVVDPVGDVVVGYSELPTILDAGLPALTRSEKHWGRFGSLSATLQTSRSWTLRGN